MQESAPRAKAQSILFEHCADIAPETLVQQVRQDGVVGQDDFVTWFAQQISLQVARIEAYRQGTSDQQLPRMSAIAVTGATASGKTFIVRAFARALGKKVFYFDCSQLTGAGWVGSNVSTCLKSIADYQDANPDTPVIALWDECDKLVKHSSYGDHLGDSFDPQRDFLSYLDGGIYSGEVKSDGGLSFELDTNLVINVFAGAFTGIEQCVRTRLGVTAEYGLVLSSENEALDTEEAVRKLVIVDDLVSYGLMREFAGRISAVTSIPPLTLEDLRRVVRTSPSSIQSRCQTLLPHGVGLEITEAAADILAQQALDSVVGARALEQEILGIYGSARAVAVSDRTVSGLVFDAENKEVAVRFLRDEGYVRPEYQPSDVDAEPAITDAEIKELFGEEGPCLAPTAEQEQLARSFPFSIDDACAVCGGWEQLANALLSEKPANPAETTLREHAKLLVSSVVSFVAKYGASDEQTFLMIDYLVSAAKPSAHESSYDCMIRQIEKGEFYDKEAHRWKKNPGRGPRPNDPAVVKFKEFSKLSMRQQNLAWRAASLQIKNYPRSKASIVLGRKLNRLYGRMVITASPDKTPSGYLKTERDSRRPFAQAANDLKVKKSELVGFYREHFSGNLSEDSSGKYCSERHLRAFVLSKENAMRNYEVCPTCNRLFHKSKLLFEACPDCFSSETEFPIEQ